jgi:hypothetical protein
MAAETSRKGREEEKQRALPRTKRCGRVVLVGEHQNAVVVGDEQAVVVGDEQFVAVVLGEKVAAASRSVRSTTPWSWSR